MDLNYYFSYNKQREYEKDEVLPDDCTKYAVEMGMVPNEKDDTNPVPYMDVIFAAGGGEKPEGPKDNEIWYWGEYYDLANVISMLGQSGPKYAGPVITSNEQVGDKYVITFDGPVTELGGNMDSMEFYPIFMNNSEMGVECNITGVEIPNSVTSIGWSAFAGCTGLTSVTIPNSVTSIGSNAFAACTGLTTIVWNAKNCAGYNFGSQVTSFSFGDEVEVIPERICEGMTNLTSITIPNSVTSIGDGAFSDCIALTSVTIGNSVTRIGDGAFAGCTGLTSVTIEAETPPALGKNTPVFDNTNNCPIYVPADSVNAYKAAEGWNTYADRIQAIP